MNFLNVLSLVLEVFTLLKPKQLTSSIATDVVTKDTYRGAVVEYQPIKHLAHEHIQPIEILRRNTEAYENLIHEAASNKVDIIVLPEYGLTTLGIPKDRIQARAYMQEIPEEGTNPCLDPDTVDVLASSVIRNISCAARMDRIYVVINLGEVVYCSISMQNESKCPKDGAFQYNTNVVFDRNGKIIAKYHKTHLYFEQRFDAPPKAELVTFDTDFGVTFGTFICFDIIFYEPSVKLVANGIRNFIYPTAWVDQLPFLLATQSLMLWAMGSNSNVLASGYHQPESGQLGSGIFSGHNGPLNYTFDPSSGTQLIISDIPKIPIAPSKMQCRAKPLNFPRQHYFPNQSVSSVHRILKEDLRNYSSILIDPENSYQSDSQVCNNNDKFCCSIKYKFSKNKKEPNEINRNKVFYRFLAFDGKRGSGKVETSDFSWQVCGLIRCLNQSIDSCSEFDQKSRPNVYFEYLTISSTSFQLDNQMKPGLNVIDTDLQIIPFHYFHYSENFEENFVQLKSTMLASMEIGIQTVAIINRTY